MRVLLVAVAAERFFVPNAATWPATPPAAQPAVQHAVLHARASATTPAAVVSHFSSLLFPHQCFGRSLQMPTSK